MMPMSLIPVASAQLKRPPDVGLPMTELPNLIFRIVNVALGIVGVVALAFIIYGGFLYITAHGEEDQVTRAKRVLTYAVFGIVVIGVAAALVNFVIGGVGGGVQGGRV